MLGKSVLITGGTGALGSAVTEEAIGRNARVTLTYIDDAEREALESTLSPSERDAVTFVAANLRDEGAVKSLVAALPRIDVLLHLVGSSIEAPIEEFTLHDFHEQIETNLTTTFLICREVFPKMVEAGYGRIVTVSSQQAVTPKSGFAVYSAAKAGVVAFTKALAHEGRQHDVTANVVLPAPMDTPETRERLPNGHLVSPTAVAQIIVSLGNTIAGHLRGAAIEVYGGAV